MLVFDDDDEQTEDGYDNIYNTMKRVQEIIDRGAAAQHSSDDCGKLSETLSKLVETCPGPKVMRLWSENLRVRTVLIRSVKSQELSSVQFSSEIFRVA